MKPTFQSGLPTDLGVVVLTQDEEGNIVRCLKAIPDSLVRIVVDSGSRDRTVELATVEGAGIIHHEFVSFASQRNWVLDQGLTGTTWVLFLDADEVATPAFWEALSNVVRHAGDDVAGAFCCWKMMLRNQWLKRCDSFPKWQLRLVRRGRLRFIDAGHGQKEGTHDGVLGYVREPYLHYAFSKGWTVWFDRHNRYATLEAAERLKSSALVRWRDVPGKPPSERNRLLKPLVSQVRIWPLIRFLHAYVIKGGFLEGAAGFDYCVLMAFYEYLIQLKMKDTGDDVQTL